MRGVGTCQAALVFCELRPLMQKEIHTNEAKTKKNQNDERAW